MAQTSVEWLINHWKKLQSEGEKMTWNQVIAITELAKEMHKEECENAWMDGFDFNSNYKDFEDYYNKTYNK